MAKKPMTRLYPNAINLMNVLNGNAISKYGEKGITFHRLPASKVQKLLHKLTQAHSCLQTPFYCFSENIF